MRILLLFFVLTSYSFALDSVDRMKTQILTVFDQNILVLNRGAEDGIFKKDHIKITSDDGFIARGICLKSSMQTSHWKIYRVVRPELVSKDVLYDLVAIPQSEWPKSLDNVEDMDLRKYLFDEVKKPEEKIIKAQQERIAKYDLPDTPPESVQEKKQVKTFLDRIVQRNFTSDIVKKDLSDLYIEIFASPFIWQSRNEQKEISYGAKMTNKGKKYQFDILLEEGEKTYIDPITRTGYEQKKSHYRLDFQLDRVTTNWSAISFLDYKQEQFGEKFYPENYYQVGLIGLKYHFNDIQNQEDIVELSFIPVFDSITYDLPNEDNSDTRDGLRFMVRLYLKTNFTKNFGNYTVMEYAPVWDFESQQLLYDDTNAKVQTNFSYKLSGDFYLDYRLEYSKDALLSEVYNTQKDNTLQMINFKYQFSL